MHMQPLFRRYGGHGTVAERLFADGICLPSGTNMNEGDIKRVVKVICNCWGS